MNVWLVEKWWRSYTGIHWSVETCQFQGENCFWYLCLKCSVWFVTCYYFTMMYVVIYAWSQPWWLQMFGVLLSNMRVFWCTFTVESAWSALLSWKLSDLWSVCCTQLSIMSTLNSINLPWNWPTPMSNHFPTAW